MVTRRLEQLGAAAAAAASVLVALLPAAAAFDVGEEVFALDILSYSTEFDPVIIPAAAWGTVYSNGSSLEVTWADSEKRGLVSEETVERKALLGICQGLDSFLPVASKALRNDSMREIDRCLAMQKHKFTTACTLAPAQEKAFPSAYARMKGYYDTCMGIGADIASPRDDLALLFQRVVAVYDIRYNSSQGSGTVVVRAGTMGQTTSRLMDLRVLWDEPAGLVGAAQLNQVDNVTCLGHCDGLTEYLDASAAAAADSDLTQAHRCLVLQEHSNSSLCAKQDSFKSACPAMGALLDHRARSCSASDDETSHVVDLPVPEVDYVHSPCAFCNSENGARDIAGLPFAKFMPALLHECKEWCATNATCSAIDYDMERNGCRLWGFCPYSSVRRQTRCYWGLYTKPSATTTSTTTPNVTTTVQVNRGIITGAAPAAVQLSVMVRGLWRAVLFAVLAAPHVR